MTGLFVTGTDTGVGKTWVTAALLRALAAAGHRCVGMKPVLTGVDPDDDAAMLLAAGNVDVPRSLANPYRFSPAIAPHVAAREEGVAMELGTITSAFDQLSQVAQVVIVEGAGGPLVPLNHRDDMLDIAKALRLRILLVVGVRLGCINHAQLCALAIRARGLVLAGWVANGVDPAMSHAPASIATLERMLAAPRIATFAWQERQWPQSADYRSLLAM
jgi:dethiobiotin synthetase